MFQNAPPLERGQLYDFFNQFSALWQPERTNRPQVEAYNSQADLLLYGGAAGGGKSDLLLGLGLTAHERSVIFRHAYVALRGLEDRLIEIIGNRSGYNANDMALRLPGCLIEFGALERPERRTSPGREGRTTSSASTRARSLPRTKCASYGLATYQHEGTALPCR